MAQMVSVLPTSSSQKFSVRTARPTGTGFASTAAGFEASAVAPSGSSPSRRGEERVIQTPTGKRTTIIISPFTPGLQISDLHAFEVFAEVGVVLLMFSIGVEFSIPDLMRVKWIALGGGTLGILLSLVFAQLPNIWHSRPMPARRRAERKSSTSV